MNPEYFAYLSIPLVSAFIGWLTNLVAVKMIFRPRREVTILGLKFIGLIPKRRKDLAEKIAETVERELISHRDIKAIIQTDEFQEATNKQIRSHILEFIEKRITSNPLLTIFVSPDIVSRLTEMLMDELQKEMPSIIDSLFEHVETKIDFKSIIRSKIEGFELSRLESIVYDIASKELHAIEWLGGVLGFVVGLVQIAILLIGKAYA